MSLNESENLLDPTFLSEEDRRRMDIIIDDSIAIEPQRTGLRAEVEELLLEVAAKAERRGMERMWEAISEWFENLSGADLNIEGAVMEALMAHFRIHHNKIPEEIDRKTMWDLDVINAETIPETIPVIPHWINLLSIIKEKYS